jgi:hypothetical protein
VDVQSIISSIAALIAAFALFLNYYQIKKNQKNFSLQIETSQKNFDKQITTTENQFINQINENQKQFLEQMHATDKINNAQLWLSFRQFLTKYDEIHLKLRPGGKWREEGTGPSSVQEWVKVEAYMGLFEHANRMLNMKLIDLDTFKDIYEYRISNIIANEIIKKDKLVDKSDSWKNFIELCNKMGLKI